MNLLIVDDTPTNLKLLRAQLEAEGHAVFEAHNGVDALALLERQRMDVVISDIFMPEMDGYRLCYEIRKHARLHDLPIILCTSTYTSVEDEKLVRDVGADKYLKRPVSRETIVAALHEVLAMPHAAPQPKALQEVEVLKEYSERLVSKLEKKNTGLQAQTEALTAEIANRKRAEKRFHTLFEFAPDAVVMIDQQGSIALVNRQAEAMFGYQWDELLGQPVEVLMPEAFRRAHVDLRQGFLGNAMPRAMGVGRADLLGLRKDGTTFPVGISLSPMESENGIMVAAAVRDMTELKRKEDALRGYATRLRELSHRLRTVEETERHAISRELHDRIGQELSTLALILGSLGAKLSQESLRAVNKQLQDMQGLVKSMVANVRNVMAELRPPVLDDYGLLAALRQFVTGFAKRSGIAAELSGVELLPRLPSIVETAMFRISQEALNNIAKHAQAKKVEISLYAASDRVVLDIVDDGIGFDTNETPPDQQHWGMITMRERAEAVGVVFHLESATGAGTRIVLEVERAAI